MSVPLTRSKKRSDLNMPHNSSRVGNINRNGNDTDARRRRTA